MFLEKIFLPERLCSTIKWHVNCAVRLVSRARLGILGPTASSCDVKMMPSTKRQDQNYRTSPNQETVKLPFPPIPYSDIFAAFAIVAGIDGAGAYSSYSYLFLLASSSLLLLLVVVVVGVVFC